jgi:DNA polymerase III epsilon subunit-like protein
MSEEVYISVDIETSGPVPGEYSMLSIGASVVGRPETSFYAELKPVNDNAVPEALAVSGLDMIKLSKDGQEPQAVMEALRGWVREAAAGRKLVFVGFNASFDWSFVNWYFHKYLGENPFGFGALDIKAYYMGFSGCRWGETTSSQLPQEFQPNQAPTHNALADAKAQAETFTKLLVARNRAKNEVV